MTASIDAVAKTLDSEPDIVLSSSNRHREWVGLALNNTTDRFITGSNKLDSITYTTVMMVYDTLYALENTVLTFGGNSNK